MSMGVAAPRLCGGPHYGHCEPIAMHIAITDPDTLTELARYGDTAEQQRIALVALSLGLHALRHARGEVDALALQQTAERVIAQMDDRVERHLSSHAATLLQQFSLDQPDSALRRLEQRHEEFYSRLVQSNGDHYAKIASSLEAMVVRRQNQRQTTQGGQSFEEAVGAVFGELAGGAGDFCDGVGDRDGTSSKCKVGDFVITLGTSCAAAGERFVIEAKRDASYGREKALTECKQARENRDARVAIFVWDLAYGQAKHQPRMARYGDDIVVLWDERDAATDVYLQAAYWLARSSMLPRPQDDRMVKTQQRLVDGAFEQILGLSAMLEKIKKAGEDVVKKGQEIATTSVNVQSLLAAQVETLRDLTVAADIEPVMITGDSQRAAERELDEPAQPQPAATARPAPAT